jgi:hypothetical protein
VAPKSRGWRRGYEPQRRRRSPRRHAAFHVLQNSVGQRQRACLELQGQGSRSAAERRCGPVSKGAGSCRRGLPRAFMCWGGLTRLEGCQSPSGRVPESSGEGRCSGPRGLGGSEDPRRGRRNLQRGTNPGEDRPAARGNSSRRERTRRRIKASRRVKLAERSEFCGLDPGGPGSASRRVKREPIAGGGTRRPRQKRGSRGNQR